MPKRLLIPLTLMMAFALPAQAQAQAQQQPLRDPDPRPMRAIDPLDGPAPAAGRVAMARYGACVANRSPGKARELLLGDFRTTQYRNGLRQLSENNRDCFYRRGRMRSPNVLFAGAIAERLLQDGERPLNRRLARAAQGNAPATFGPSDQFAQCVVRSAPDETSALFATPIESEAEAKAADALGFVVGRCGQGRQVEVNLGGLRAILATAAFRNVEVAK